MIKFLALVIVAALASGRIVGGEDTTIEQVPHQVSLRALGVHICGGSIISKNWILTAGHCVVRGNLHKYSIKAGSSHRNWGGSVHALAAVVLHENYGTTNHGSSYNDVALIRVRSRFAFDRTRQPVELFNSGEELSAGVHAIITGWGSTATSKRAFILQIVRVPIVSKKQCSIAYGIWGGLPKGQICAAYPGGGKDACQGDSGGPMTVNGRLAGITSWGKGCAEPGFPGAYTEVATYREWIRRNSGV